MLGSLYVCGATGSNDSTYARSSNTRAISWQDRVARPVQSEQHADPRRLLSCWPRSRPFGAAENTDSKRRAASDYKVMLDLVAHEATWLSVSSDGKPVFSGILQANQSKSVGGKQFAKMRVGNAAGIEVRLNGKLLGPLGARGQVLVVLFTPDNFQIVSPPKESD